MIDLNPTRRRREISVAKQVAAEMMRGTSIESIAPPELLAHHFATVCERMQFVPTQDSAKRVLAYTLKEIQRADREISYLQRQMARLGDRLTPHQP